MSDLVDLEFTYKHHRIQVSHGEVADTWLNDYDTIFTVLIDGIETVAPGIWKAYQIDGEPGIKLVVEAFVDNSRESTDG